MKNKKKRVVLLEDVVSLEKFNELVKEDIFPLAIALSEQELEEYTKNRSKNSDTSNSSLINSDLYAVTRGTYLTLNPYDLRKKIESNEIYVDKFINKNNKVKNVRFIVPAFGYDLDAPKIVFRKTPRLFFKKADHFSEDAKYEGEDLLNLVFDAVWQYQKKIG